MNFRWGAIPFYSVESHVNSNKIKTSHKILQKQVPHLLTPVFASVYMHKVYSNYKLCPHIPAIMNNKLYRDYIMLTLQNLGISFNWNHM